VLAVTFCEELASVQVLIPAFLTMFAVALCEKLAYFDMCFRAPVAVFAVAFGKHLTNDYHLCRPIDFTVVA